MQDDLEGAVDVGQLSAVLASLPISTLILDEHGRVCWANGEAATFGRASARELVGRTFGHSAGCVRAYEGCAGSPACAGCPLDVMIRRSLHEGRSLRMVELGRPFERPGVLDTPRVVASSSRAMVGGRPHVVITLQALEAQAQPQRDAPELVTVTNALAEALFTVRLPERVIEYVNRAAEELFEIPARELIGSPTTLLYPDAQHATEFGEKLAAALAAKQPQLRTEQVFVRGNGQRFWGAISTTFLFEGGSLTRVISVVTDVSERKRMEQELAQSEHRYRLVFERAPVGVALFDVPSGRYLAVNSRHCEIIGYPRAQALQQRVLERGHVEDLATNTQALARLRANADVVEFETRLVRANGELAYVRVTLMTVGEGPDANLAIALCEDLTARRKLDQEKAHIAESLRERQKLDSLGMLAGGIAHDFNNILGVVTLNVDSLRRALPPDSKARHKLEIISDATMRATDLTRQLLAYAGRGRLVVERVDLATIIDGMQRLLRLSVSSKTTLDLRLRGVSVIKADSTQLRQVIMNLVINASQALADGCGRVELSLHEQHLLSEAQRRVVLGQMLAPGRYVVLDVQDQGHGIAPEQIEQIFDPFYTTKANGHGLGLSAILGIVTSHGGGVQVESTVGVGSRFRVLLPALGGVVAAKPRPPAPAPEWCGDGRALLVDDEPVLRLAAREMLEQLGFTVSEARHGREALVCLQQSALPFAFVLLDLTMPVMDGLETLERMRELGISAPVILVSGYRRRELGERYESAGYSGFLHKPYDVRELTAAVRAVVEAHAQASQNVSARGSQMQAPG